MLKTVGVPIAADQFVASAVVAVLRKDAVIIETRVEQEIPWLEFVNQANAAIGVIASSGMGFGGRRLGAAAGRGWAGRANGMVARLCLGRAAVKAARETRNRPAQLDATGWVR